jgi:hypothetical protein
LEQAPVSFREPLEELADFKVVAGHGADQRDQFLADIFGHRLLVHLDREVVASLGGVFVEGALEEIQSVVDLAFELLLAKLEEFTLFAHDKYAYIYAYFKPGKSARQEVNVQINAKNRPEEQNCY